MSNPSIPARRSRRGSGAVTLHDVAKLAGVAPITASRALNTPGQVSAEVLKKVGDAVARTGYVRNGMAGGAGFGTQPPGRCGDPHAVPLGTSFNPSVNHTHGATRV